MPCRAAVRLSAVTAPWHSLSVAATPSAHREPLIAVPLSDVVDQCGLLTPPVSTRLYLIGATGR